MSELQSNLYASLMALASDVMDGKYGKGDDLDIAAFTEDHDEALAFILEDEE